MTLFEAYQEGLKKLKNPELEEINLRILLCENNHLKSMSEFYLKKDENIKDLQAFYRDLQRFLDGEPVQYIVGKCTFFGEDFLVTNNVLIPRNETEEVVAFAIGKIKQKFPNKKVKIVDVCCGTGCIGCSIYKNANVEEALFSDISPKALEIARKNAKNLMVKGRFAVSDALDYLHETVEVVIGNPPYILNKDDVDESVLKYEPHLALFIDDDLTIYRKILQKSVTLNVPLIIFEIGYDLKEKITKLFKDIAKGYKISFIKDMNGKDRICSLEKIL